MIGLEPFRPDLIDDAQCIDAIEAKVQEFTADELEVINAANKQAGVTALKRDAFLGTNYVSIFSFTGLKLSY